MGTGLDPAAIAHGVRCRVFRHCMTNNGGYLSQACSAGDIMAWLYAEALDLGEPTLPPLPLPFSGVPSAGNPDYVTGAGYNGAPAPDRDRLIVAPAHYALLTYATLVEVGRMDPAGLEMFNRDGSSVEMIGAEHSPGMEVHNGTLGVGLSTGAGLAFGRRLRGDTGQVCVFMSDGELQEGQTWEAVQAMAHHGIDNLWAVMDVNDQQCDGAMGSVMDVRDPVAKMRAFGAVVVEVDAHDLDALRAAKATPHDGAPLIILARSSPTHTMPYLERRMPRLHYVRFTDPAQRAEMNQAIAAELGIEPVDLGEA